MGKTEELHVSVLEPKELKCLRIATLNVLTLGPAEEREANGLRIPARQARPASTFQEAGIDIIGLQKCDLPAHVVVWEGFVMITSGAEEGRRNGYGLWLSTRRVGREHLTIVHSSPSVLWVAVRSQTVEANVVVAHSPVEGHERAEDWWETLSELLLSFVNDAPTYVCIDANGWLGSPTSNKARWKFVSRSRNT